MQKYLIGGIQKFSTSDGPGIRTTVFIKGCPLRCKWCHNPEMMFAERELFYSQNRCISCGACMEACPSGALQPGKDKPIMILRDKCCDCGACVEQCYSGALRWSANYMTIEQIMEQVLQDKEFYDKTNGGVTLSGGEIMQHPRFAREMLAACQKAGIRVAIDTSGFCKYEDLREIASQAQIILYDIKSLDDEVHLRYAGKSNSLILENLRKLSGEPGLREKIQIRMPLLKDMNDTPAIIGATAVFLDELDIRDVVLIPYHKLGISKLRSLDREVREYAPPTDQRLQEIKDTFAQYGIKAEIIGQGI